MATIIWYAKKLKSQYNRHIYLETIRCYFDMPQEIYMKTVCMNIKATDNGGLCHES